MFLKPKKILKKLISLILKSLGIFTLISCKETSAVSMYGMPPNFRQVSGTVLGNDTNGDGTPDPISGIQYSYVNQQSVAPHITDKDGFFCIDLYNSEDSVTVSFKDIDGKENGSYEDKDVVFSLSENNKFIIEDIKLKTKEK